MNDITSFAERIKSQATSLGFDLCGAAPAVLCGELEHFPSWVAEGRAGDMEYLKSRNEDGTLKRSSLKVAAPWARSVIVCALNYNSAPPYSTEITDKARGWISRYAWFGEPQGTNTDYHDAILRRLRRLEDWINSEWRNTHSAEIQSRSYVDTGPVIERVFAKYAGIGWLAKNTCIINPELGSWLFLGVILTSIDFAGSYALPPEDRCGSCTRCIAACPTGAITEPYKLDARLCISYLTIEKRGGIAPELREKMGQNIFGCDICQDVCPWNGAVDPRRKPPASTLPEFQPREELLAPELAQLARMSREEFNQIFRRSPVKRAKYQGMLRNIAIAIGNSGRPQLAHALEPLLANPDPVVADAARWAMERLAPSKDSA